VAGLANLDIVESEGLVENARIVGAYLLEQLQKNFGDSPITGEIRGLGMLTAIEVVRDRETREPFPNLGDTGWIASECFERGLIARALFQSVSLCPPLCANTGDIDRMIEILASVWADAEAKFAGVAV
jgi:adenosylmethionine-8-amino-7-oxononanoate aminotransferase